MQNLNFSGINDDFDQDELRDRTFSLPSPEEIQKRFSKIMTPKDQVSKVVPIPIPHPILVFTSAPAPSDLLGRILTVYLATCTRRT